MSPLHVFIPRHRHIYIFIYYTYTYIYIYTYTYLHIAIYLSTYPFPSYLSYFDSWVCRKPRNYFQANLDDVLESYGFTGIAPWLLRGDAGAFVGVLIKKSPATWCLEEGP